MRVHILRPESITPIGRYLDVAASEPSSYDRQKELGALILYREREYRSMYASRWLRVGGPPPDVDPFGPFTLTSDGSAALDRHFGVSGAGTHAGPFDLFGLKPKAIASLRAVLRPCRKHGLGWLLFARLLDDLTLHEEAMQAARAAVEAGETVHGLALLWSAAVGSHGGDEGHPSHRIARVAERDLRAALRATRRPVANGPGRLREDLDERIRRIALRTRVRAEGPAFTRYWTTAREFCGAERAAASGGFDDGRVPPDVRALAHLARRFGVGDDVCRALFLRELPHAERVRLRETVLQAATAIQRWLDESPAPPSDAERTCFFWLLQAAEDVEV